VSRTEATPTTVQELAAMIVNAVRHHERNCRHCAPLPCVECPWCRARMEETILELLRSVNKRSA